MINWDYQKALDRINHSVWQQDMETTEYVATLQDALGKQIGKKVKEAEELYEGRNKFYPLECPNCNGGFTGDTDYDYCPMCGQKLEW